MLVLWERGTGLNKGCRRKKKGKETKDEKKD
jgi:hypothetical protein